MTISLGMKIFAMPIATVIQEMIAVRFLSVLNSPMYAYVAVEYPETLNQSLTIYGSQSKINFTHKTPTIKRHITKSVKFFMKADEMEKIEDKTNELRMTHLRPLVSPRNPQK